MANGLAVWTAYYSTEAATSLNYKQIVLIGEQKFSECTSKMSSSNKYCPIFHPLFEIHIIGTYIMYVFEKICFTPLCPTHTYQIFYTGYIYRCLLTASLDWNGKSKHTEERTLLKKFSCASSVGNIFMYYSRDLEL